MKTKLIILSLEPLESRYTSEWYFQLPKIFNDYIRKMDLHMEVISIDGKSNLSNKVTPGAFLNFTETNIWKNNQLNQIAKMFSDGKINPGDKFLITDAWNPSVIQIKYMSELMDIPVEIHSIWHAGSYDPQDFLGRKIKNKRWSYNFERSIFHASDCNYFATAFHANMFLNTLNNEKDMIRKVYRVGFPFEYLREILEPYSNVKKEDIILFPHRLAPEKQPSVFSYLSELLPEYKFIFCQQTELTKEEYHKLLGKAKMVFSANLQETLGISCFEGMLVNALPLVPDRLSYTEMYNDRFKYPSDMTLESGNIHYGLVAKRIKFMMDNYDEIVSSKEFLDTKRNLINNYFGSEMLVKNILTSKIEELV